MIFKLDELPKNSFELFLEFIGKGRNFNEVSKYFKERKLQTIPSFPAVYKFTNKYGKSYYGKANDLFERLEVYVKLDSRYINSDLRDDLILEGYNYFTYSVITEFHDMKITEANVLDAENYYTSRAHSSGLSLYNKTNKKLKLEIRKSHKKNVTTKKVDRFKDDFRGFGDIFG